MLQQIRDRITGWIAGIVFGMIAIAFIFWGVTGYIGNTDVFFAKVNGEEISIRDYRDALQNQLAQYREIYPDGIPPAIEDRVKDNVINAVIERELLDQHAQAQGYGIGNDELRRRIRETPQFQVDGTFNRAVYEARLGAAGLTPSQYELMLQRSLRVNQLRDSIGRTAFSTPIELRRAIELLNERRELAYVVIPVANYMAGIEISEEEIERYYDEHPALYETEETVDLQFIELTQEDIVVEVLVSDDDLLAFYEDELATGRFAAPEERRARHILMAVDAEEDVETKRELATELLERIRNGEDFAALAEEYSDDPGSAAEGGSLDWAERDAFVGPFGEALFSMETNELIGPVRSEFGFHVIELLEVRGGERQSLEEVRDELEPELRQVKAEELYYERADQLRQAAFDAFDNLEQVHKKLGLQINVIEGVPRAGGEGIAQYAEVTDVAFSDSVLLDRENSELIELLDNRVVVIRVKDHHRATVKPLKEVRDELVASLQLEQARVLAEADGVAVRERVEAGDALDSLAEVYEAQFHPAQFISRTAFQLSPDLLQATFAAAKPAPGRPVIVDVALPSGDYAVLAITDVRIGSPAEMSEEERLQRRNQLALRLGFGEYTAYVESLRDDASIIVQEQQDDIF